jgi:hypothetical protein
MQLLMQMFMQPLQSAWHPGFFLAISCCEGRCPPSTLGESAGAPLQSSSHMDLWIFNYDPAGVNLS